MIFHIDYYFGLEWVKTLNILILKLISLLIYLILYIRFIKYCMNYNIFDKTKRYLIYKTIISYYKVFHNKYMEYLILLDFTEDINRSTSENLPNILAINKDM